MNNRHRLEDLLKAVLVGVLFILAVVIIDYPILFSKTSDERLNDTMQELQEVVSKMRYTSITDYLHNDFRANQRHDPDTIKRMMRIQFVGGKKSKLTLLNIKNTISESTFDAKTTGTAIFSQGLSSLPRGLTEYQFTLLWVRDGNNWLVRSARWE